MELSNQLPGSHPLTAPVHPLERVTGPPELHHSEGRYRVRRCSDGVDQPWGMVHKVKVGWSLGCPRQVDGGPLTRTP